MRATMYQADIDKLKAERLLQQRALPDKLRGLPVLMADDDKDCCESTCLLLREAVGDQVPILFLTAYDWSAIEAQARTPGPSPSQP